MKKSPIFRDSTEVSVEDMDNFVDNIKKSDDDIVVDALQRGRRFTGLVVQTTSSTSVSVGAGRLWFDGARYYLDDTGGLPLDLLPIKPTLQKRIIAIVAYPETVQSDLEYRDYETDAETGVKEPRQVNVNEYRHIRLEAVAGAQAVSPQNPVIDASAVIIAYVSMDTTGITSVARNFAAELDNLGDVAGRVTGLEDWRDQVDPQIGAITSQIADIESRLSRIGSNELQYALAVDMARVKEKMAIPAAYVNYRADFFLNDSQSDKTAMGYAARTDEGLRFAPEAENETQLAIFNQYNPDVMTSGDGMVLPKYENILSRVVKGGVGEMSLAQYAYELRTTTLLTTTRARVRYGAEFEQSAGSQFFLSGQFTPGVNATYQINLFQRAGETFQAYETGRTDAEGYKIYRFSQFWQDSLSSPYWSRVNSQQNLTGYAFVETFVQQRDAWVTGISARVSKKPNSGNLYVGICEATDAGYPDITRMITLVHQDAPAWVPEGGYGYNIVDTPPIFLKGGKRYGYVLMTQADYWVQVVETGTSPTTGTLFYGLNGGVWQSEPNRHIMFDLRFASFKQNQVSVDLQGLSLSGGISAIDLLSEQIVPDSTSLTFEVQINGVWKPLSATTTASVLAAKPPLVPLRAVFSGTSDIMPGLRLANSRCRVSRPKTALKHVTKTETLAAPSSSIKTVAQLRNFDAAHHTHTQTLLVGAGYTTVETADSVVDVVRGDVTERTCVFNLAAPASSYKRVVAQTTDDAANLFVVDSLSDVAT